MKYIKLLSLMLCAIILFSLFAGCGNKKNYEYDDDEYDIDDKTDTSMAVTIPASLIPDSPKGTDDAETVRSRVEKYNDAMLRFLAGYKSVTGNFFPSVFDGAGKISQGKFSAHADKLSLMGNDMLDGIAYSADGVFARNDDSFAFTGKLSGKSETSFGLYKTTVGDLLLSLPEVDENTCVRLMENLNSDAFSGFRELLDSFGFITPPASENNETSDIIIGSIIDSVNSRLLSEETVSLELFGNTYNNVTKLTFKLNEAMSASNTIKSKLEELTGISVGENIPGISVVFYIIDGAPVRAEFTAEGLFKLFIDSQTKESHTIYEGSLAATVNEKNYSLSFEGEQTADAINPKGNIAFEISLDGLDIGDETTNLLLSGLDAIKLGLSYDRTVSGNETDTDYNLAVGIKVIGQPVTLSIPFKTETIHFQDGTVRHTLTVDTKSSYLFMELAEFKLSFTMEISPQEAQTVDIPEFSEENILSVTDPADSEALAVYFEKAKEKIPDIKNLIQNIIGLIGGDFGDVGTEDELNGIYVSDSIGGAYTQYEFSEGYNVTYSAFVFGMERKYTGTYSVNDDKITFDFGTGTIAQTLSGTFDFIDNGDTVTINSITYTKR